MTLRYALEDYAKVTGTAGSIFGAIYYVDYCCCNLFGF